MVQRLQGGKIVILCDTCPAELHTMASDKCDALGIAHDEGWRHVKMEDNEFELCQVCAKDHRYEVES